ncbi:SigE family RNA polymerase sigma factor [Fodinicola feengrottensis]|uniref:SigE family RNA polymerase sigma factor n=1 Tax=Fodinicola feengrottensis TaxID=435914 RepID=A0ABN2IR04_9ACTN|nr:SigE family RNA polymerase sigma factor [Fodinicola feengrottensis]
MTVDGDDQGFVAFVSDRSASLLRTAYLLVGDQSRAEDLLQTALTKTYLRWGQLRDPAAATAYVRRVLANTATSWWRLRSFSERPTDRLPEVPGADQIGAREDQLAMWRHLQALPARQRTVLVLRYYEDLTERETAAAMGISVGGVKSMASRGLTRLRALMGISGDVMVAGEVF